MVFPSHFTQTERARRALEIMQSELDDCARAIAALLAGEPLESPVDTLKQHMTSDGYGLSFTGFDDVRCPSCGAPTWSLQFDNDGDCIKCQEARQEEDTESLQAWHDHLADQADTAAYEGGDC